MSNRYTPRDWSQGIWVLALCLLMIIGSAYACRTSQAPTETPTKTPFVIISRTPDAPGTVTAPALSSGNTTASTPSWTQLPPGRQTPFISPTLPKIGVAVVQPPVSLKNDDSVSVGCAGGTCYVNGTPVAGPIAIAAQTSTPLPPPPTPTATVTLTPVPPTPFPSPTSVWSIEPPIKLASFRTSDNFRYSDVTLWIRVLHADVLQDGVTVYVWKCDTEGNAPCTNYGSAVSGMTYTLGVLQANNSVNSYPGSAMMLLQDNWRYRVIVGTQTVDVYTDSGARDWQTVVIQQ